MDLNNPIPQEWSSYVTQSPVALEIVPAVLYDTQTFVDATTVDLSFFTAVPANLSIGNLKQPGMLSNPQSFLIQSIRIYYKVTLQAATVGGAGTIASLTNDIILLVNTGVFTMSIGQKQYGPWPMWMLPASTYFQGMIGSGAVALETSYGQIGGPLYPLFPNLMISPLQQFEVHLVWPSGAPDLTTNMSVEVLFDGQLARAVQ
jgi:hypothetical protein